MVSLPANAPLLPSARKPAAVAAAARLQRQGTVGAPLLFLLPSAISFV